MKNEFGTEEVCRRCHSKLQRLQWNTECDILVCYNPSCELFHQPQKTVKVLKRSMLSTLGVKRVTFNWNN